MKQQKHLSDHDILKRFHQFMRDDDQKKIDPSNLTQEDYGEIAAKKYYDKLYKEYAFIDLSRYQTGQIGMRWRTEQEVITGKGERSCAVKGCSEIQGLKSYEVPFSYVERGEKKLTLVKCRVCEECSLKLNYKKKHDEVQTNELDEMKIKDQDKSSKEYLDKKSHKIKKSKK